MNFEEFKKEVLIYDMSFGKFLQYCSDILNMQKNNENKKAAAYTEVLSHATVKPVTKYQMVLVKGYLEGLKYLIKEKEISNQSSAISR